MLSEKKTHRELRNPRISIRFLADYMAAMGRSSHRAAQSIIQGCKYQAIGHVLQHTEAQSKIGRFICGGTSDLVALSNEAVALRQRLATDDFERQLWDLNADFIDRFAAAWPDMQLPEGTIYEPGPRLDMDIHGCKLSAWLSFRVRRRTRTNKIRLGGGTVRYAKGKSLPPQTGAWQSALLQGLLAATNTEEEAEPEGKLCVTIDAFTGDRDFAPTNAVTRFKEAELACARIADLWPTIKPPKHAIL